MGTGIPVKLAFNRSSVSAATAADYRIETGTVK